MKRRRLSFTSRYVLAFGANGQHLPGSAGAVDDAAIRALNRENRPIVFLLWGSPAQRKAAMLNNPNHLILKAPHPSPLSAYRGFFGCGHFARTNQFLTEHGLDPIDWQIDNI